MKALVCRQYGPADLLRIEEVETPTPGPGEVLVKIEAAAANAGDWHMFRGQPVFLRLMGFGFFRPRDPILGVDIAGEVAEVGAGVADFTPGDQVFGCTAIGEALTEYGGAFAEYVCVPEGKLAPRPEGLTAAQAAAVPQAALTALQAVRDAGKVTAGSRVLVNGASGGVGTFAVQIAKSMGAHVTGVCSTRNLELVRSIGADEVIDYTRHDFTAGDARYDVIVDAAAFRSVLEIRRVLTADGVYVMVGGSTARFLQSALLGPLLSLGGARVVAFSVAETKADLLILGALLQAGTIAPVIDRSYPLSEGAEALRYVEQGHVRGKVVITV